MEKMVVTIFLSVLILALFLGNAFLSLTDPKRLKAAAKQREINGTDTTNSIETINGSETVLESQQYAQEEVRETVQQKYNFQETEEIQNNESKILVAKSKYDGNTSLTKSIPLEESSQVERVDYLNRRIARLEQLLLKLNGNGSIAQKINTTELTQKLDSLGEFKQNTTLEIAALKQRLDKIQPVEKKKKQNIPKISDKKLRDLVFRASN